MISKITTLKDSTTSSSRAPVQPAPGCPARAKVEESLAEVARLTRRLNEQVSLSRSIFPGIQMTPVRVEAHLERFDVDCPRVDDVPEDLARLLRQAVRAASPPWWKRLLA